MVHPAVHVGDPGAGHIDHVVGLEIEGRRRPAGHGDLHVEEVGLPLFPLGADDDHVVRQGFVHVEPAGLENGFQGGHAPRHGDEPRRLDLPAHVDPPGDELLGDDRHIGVLEEGGVAALELSSQLLGGLPVHLDVPHQLEGDLPVRADEHVRLVEFGDIEELEVDLVARGQGDPGREGSVRGRRRFPSGNRPAGTKKNQAREKNGFHACLPWKNKDQTGFLDRPVKPGDGRRTPGRGPGRRKKEPGIFFYLPDLNDFPEAAKKEKISPGKPGLPLVALHSVPVGAPADALFLFTVQSYLCPESQKERNPEPASHEWLRSEKASPGRREEQEKIGPRLFFLSQFGFRSPPARGRISLGMEEDTLFFFVFKRLGLGGSMKGESATLTS